MTPADDAETLQFETAIPQNGTSETPDGPTGVSCRACQREITDEYFDVSGQQVCASCRDVIAESGEIPRGAVPLVRAALFGFAAAVAGAILYYAVIAITNFEIGLVAIAIGFMVGYAIQKGTRGRGGRRFQVMALVLTYWSVGLAYFPLALRGVAEQERAAVQSQANGTVTPTAVQPAEPAPSSPTDGAVIGFPVALAYFIAFTFMLPVLMIFGSLPGGLISAAIIAFGMHQAWRMTASPQFTITGPFRVRPAGPAAT